MSELWWALGLCVIFIASAALPLLRDRKTTEIRKKETLRDWRKADD